MPKRMKTTYRKQNKRQSQKPKKNPTLNPKPQNNKCAEKKLPKLKLPGLLLLFRGRNVGADHDFNWQKWQQRKERASPWWWTCWPELSVELKATGYHFNGRGNSAFNELIKHEVYQKGGHHCVYTQLWQHLILTSLLKRQSWPWQYWMQNTGVHRFYRAAERLLRAGSQNKV